MHQNKKKLFLTLTYQNFKCQLYHSDIIDDGIRRNLSLKHFVKCLAWWCQVNPSRTNDLERNKGGNIYIHTHSSNPTKLQVDSMLKFIKQIGSA